MRIYIIITFILSLSYFAYGRGTYHKVKWGDTLYSLGKRYNSSYGKLLLLNPTLTKDNLKAGRRIRVSYYSGHAARVHKIKKGETLWSISRKYSLSVDEIRKLNRLGNNSHIGTGQNIIVSALAHSPSSHSPSFSTKRLRQSLFWPTNGNIVGSYGRANHLFSSSIKIRTSKNIRSALDGKVTFVGKLRSHGNAIIISHSNDFLTMYCSKDMRPLVSLGKIVNAKELIAVKKSKFMILDFYVRSGNMLVNPIYYLKNNNQL